MENSNALVSILSESVCAYQHRLRRLLNLGHRLQIFVEEIFVEFIFTWDILNLILKVLLEPFIFNNCWSMVLFFAIEIRLSLRLFSMVLYR